MEIREHTHLSDSWAARRGDGGNASYQLVGREGEISEIRTGRAIAQGTEDSGDMAPDVMKVR